jgi:thioredoxin reductase (NADPH)
VPAKWLGIPSESKFKGYGVSACATCDGFFYRGKPVVVVGGGNTAVEEALYLSHIAAKVMIVHRRDSFRAERILQERLLKRPNVERIFDHVVEEVCGSSDPLSVSHLRLRNVKTGDVRELETHGVFVAIGHEPASGLFKSQLHQAERYIKTRFLTATRSPACSRPSDVTDDIRQAVAAAGLGCRPHRGGALAYGQPTRKP